MESKVNIGLTLSRNFQNVKLELVEEPIEYESDEQFKARVRQKFDLLKAEVDLEFEKLQ